MIAALFVRSDSIYKSIPGVDCYDIERDSLNFPGGYPIIAHPPCRSWGKLSHFSQPRPGEKDLSLWAVDQVQKNGGVLEHPVTSRLFKEACLPSPGKRDSFGGFVLGVNQSWFGHRAEKSTLLYIVGIEPRAIPVIPLTLNSATTTVENLCSAEREKTPVLFAQWLVDLANIIKSKRG